METIEAKKVIKSQPKKSGAASLRVTHELRKQLKAELAKINRGGFKVKATAVLTLLLSRLTADDAKALQEQSLSSRQRVERAHRAYISQNGPISYNEFLDMRINGKRRDSSEKQQTIPQDKE